MLSLIGHLFNIIFSNEAPKFYICDKGGPNELFFLSRIGDSQTGRFTFDNRSDVWPKHDRRPNHLAEWLRTIKFLGAFSHTCPKGARITDTNTFHWGKWEQRFAWPWFETSRVAARYTRTPRPVHSLQRALESYTRRSGLIDLRRRYFAASDTLLASSDREVTRKWFVNNCKDIGSKSGATHYQREVCVLLITKL